MAGSVLVYIAGALMGPVALAFILFHSFTLAVWMGVIFGLGYGAYESVRLGAGFGRVALDGRLCKDMGVWHVAMVLPQVIATPIAGGALLDNFQRVGRSNNLPDLRVYRYFSDGSGLLFPWHVFVKQIKGAR